MSTSVIGRVERVQQGMKDHGADILVFGPSGDQLYFSGVRLPQTERFNAVVVPREGRPTIVVPSLQAPLVPQAVRGQFDVTVWQESDDPLRAVFRIDEKARRIGVDGGLWSRFLLGLGRHFPKGEFFDAGSITGPLRINKDEAEIAILWDNGKRFDAVWEEFFTTGRMIGRTENEVRRQLGELVVAHGFAEGMVWCDVASGPNGASPLHHGSERVIQRGEPVVIDFAAIREGYHMDTCRTPIAGEPAAEFVRIYDIVNRAHAAAAAAIRPGVTAESIDAAGRAVIAAEGLGGCFIHRLGHGLGIDAHEAPYLVWGNHQLLSEGMVFSNEPGIYVPHTWGVRIENIMVVTAEGGRSFNEVTRSLVCMA